MLAIFLSTSLASAAIDPACQSVADQGVPDDYSEQGQQDWLLNYFSMVGAFSPLHSAIPHKPGTGAIGVELAVIPPVSCEHRLVLAYTKTEDTNKLPVLPRPRMSFALPASNIGSQVIVPYGGLGYVPPLPLPDSASLDGGNMQNTIVSIEAGFGGGNADFTGLQYGARFHATVMKTVAEIATPFDSSATVSYKDLYLGSTFGIDAMVGWGMENINPYLALGFLDVSTFFYIDDDAVITNNETPYAGLTAATGLAWSPKPWLEVAAEVYAVPGYVYTGKTRLSYIFK